MDKEKYVLPAVALRGMTIVPGMTAHFDLNRPKSVKAVEQAMLEDGKIFLVTQRDAQEEDPDAKGLYDVGTAALIRHMEKLKNNIIRVMVEGQERCRLLRLEGEETEYLLAEVERYELAQTELSELEEEAMIRHVRGLLETYRQAHPKRGLAFMHRLEEYKQLDKLLTDVMNYLPISDEVRQKALEQPDLQGRYECLAEFLYNEVEIARVRNELAENIRGRVEKNQRNYLLREQLNYIREELGEDSGISDADLFEEECSALTASEEVKEKIKKEIRRFRSVSASTSESAVERVYIETLLELPWDKSSIDNQDLNEAEQVLQEEHYGLEQVKERILEFLAVRSLTREGDSPILCLVGPPGTGKTSIAKSVARALHKKYVRICLGGVRDEAEIRGHRKTYVGAMPGRIVAGLKQAGVKNPLMLLDEIDKVSSDYKGDTSSALLEVLDSEQNSRFRDHYVEIPIDLSEILFIATANSTETIPRPLLDRMELIEVTSYTANEKFHIAKEHLVEKQLRKNGMEGKLLINDAALRKIIEHYTRESGVRELERKIGEICRKAAREILQKKKESIKVTSGNLETYLGKKKYTADKANSMDEIGIVRGLAWTSVGGDTLQIEVNKMPGKGEIELTGQLGDVMKESAMAGISYIRSVSKEYKIPADTFKKNDFHIHIPEGAVPKDGPSAGITMAAAMLSAITETPVRADVAMTGEITLRGRILPIGGLKEKILAAKTAGIRTVLVPRENEKDVAEISKEIKNGIQIIYVEHMREVIEQAFTAQTKG